MLRKCAQTGHFKVPWDLRRMNGDKYLLRDSQ